MNRVFLSHSSKDKALYVKYIADKFGKDRCIYDEFSFNAGMKTIDEIFRCINKTDIFVALLSDDSLSSKWVNEELFIANERLQNKQLKQIFPIIIDPKINHKDSRIPYWMRESYNLQIIKSPKLAYEKIYAELCQAAWEADPVIEKRDNIFFGRNIETDIVERRFNNITLPPVKCLIVSGIERIGRKALMKYTLSKLQIMERKNKPLIISLQQHDGIEDFILHIGNLGFRDIDIKYIAGLAFNDKIKYATDLVIEVQNYNNYIFINDNDCLIKHNGEISWWFLRILINVKLEMVFGIASNYQVNAFSYRKNSDIFHISINGLEKSDRDGLLRLYATLADVEFEREDLLFLSELLKGYPEQVYFAVDLVKGRGIEYVKKVPQVIIEYSNDKVLMVLRQYENNEQVLEFIKFLSRFDFISTSLIDKIIDKDKGYILIVNELISRVIIEGIGANREYYKLNESIRDFISRNKIQENPFFEEILLDEFKKLTENQKYYREIDYATLNFYIKETLKAGNPIDEHLLIPSHYVKTIVEMYNNREFRKVIRFAYKTIESESLIVFEEHMKSTIYYYLCLALARDRDKRFEDIVNNIEGLEFDFLWGFYYRRLGKISKAIECYNRVLAKNSSHRSSKRELVSALIMSEEFESARILAKENYEEDNNNPYHIQAYFRCIINEKPNKESSDLLKTLIENMARIKSDVALGMLYEMKAQYIAIYDKNIRAALFNIDRGVKECPTSKSYLLLAKFDICSRFNNLDEMKRCIDSLVELGFNNRPDFKNAFYYRDAIYKQSAGMTKHDIAFSLSKIENLPDKTYERFKQRLGII